MTKTYTSMALHALFQPGRLGVTDGPPDTLFTLAICRSTYEYGQESFIAQYPNEASMYLLPMRREAYKVGRITEHVDCADAVAAYLHEDHTGGRRSRD